MSPGVGVLWSFGLSSPKSRWESLLNMSGLCYGGCVGLLPVLSSLSPLLYFGRSLNAATEAFGVNISPHKDLDEEKGEYMFTTAPNHTDSQFKNP